MSFLSARAVPSAISSIMLETKKLPISFRAPEERVRSPTSNTPLPMASRYGLACKQREKLPTFEGPENLHEEPSWLGPKDAKKENAPAHSFMVSSFDRRVALSLPLANGSRVLARPSSATRCSNGSSARPAEDGRKRRRGLGRACINDATGQTPSPTYHR